MWEGLVNLPPDVNLLFNKVTGSSVRIKFCRLLRNLLGSATTIIEGFGNLIESSGSEDASPDGGVLQLTESVVCYMATISEHGEILNVLFKDEGWLELDPVPEEEQSHGISCIFWPNDCYLHSVACDLESILDSKSKLYEDISLQHIFLMNNIHYMVKKVRRSKLKHLLGDEWISEHVKKVQWHATTYRRITLGSVLSSLIIDGTEQLLLASTNFSCPAGSLTKRSKSPKSILKPKISAFNVAFEKTYKRQTGWLIPDIEIREDLRISIAQILILAYRTFVGQYSLHEIIKYTAEDLTICLWHLFEGSSRNIAKFQQEQS